MLYRKGNLIMYIYVCFEKIDQLTLSKYAHMIHSGNIHDDLDVATSVYLPESKSIFVFM